MKSLFGFLVCLALCSVTQADIILTIGSGTFAQNSGIQSIDVFARSNDTNSLVGLTAFFELEGGIFEVPPGAFGQPGMIGSGNINAIGSNFQREPADPMQAGLSIEFLSPQLFPPTDTLLARLDFDVNGLTPGTYEIRFLNAFANGDPISTSNLTNGGFTISSGAAVPEPGHAVILLISGLSVFGGHRLLVRRQQLAITRN